MTAQHDNRICVAVGVEFCEKEGKDCYKCQWFIPVDEVTD